MGKDTHIEWCDHTFNPWEGCTKVSPGCANCYAETRNARFGGGTAPNWGKGAPRRRTSVQNWHEPVKWDREAKEEFIRKAHQTGAGEVIRHNRPRVFCASLADWLDDEVPIEWLADLLDLIRKTPHLDWLLLTKRPENWRARIGHAGEYAALHPDRYQLHLMLRAWCHDMSPSNVWLGTTVENQDMADKRIPALLRIPARVRFLSCEPLLGPVSLGGFDGKHYRSWLDPVERASCGIHWLIAGGESGPKARPMHPDWARDLRDQCAAAGVPFLFKQWGEWAQARVMTQEEERSGPPRIGYTFIQEDGEIITSERVGKKAAGRLLDGIEHNGFPNGGAS